MSFVDWLERTHNRPHEARVRLMWVSAVCAILVIAVFWVFSVAHDLKVAFRDSSMHPSVEAALNQKGKNSTPSLMDTLKASVGDFLDVFKFSLPADTGNTNSSSQPSGTTPSRSRTGGGLRQPSGQQSTTGNTTSPPQTNKPVLPQVPAAN